MTCRRLLPIWTSWLPVLCAACGLAPVTAGAEPPVASPIHTAEITTFADVALAPGGLLHGLLVDQNGRPVVGGRVELWQPSRRVTAAQSAVDGTFAFANLDGGLYQVTTLGQTVSCRLWTPHAAPPCARDELVLSGSGVVRGQRNYKPFPYPRTFHKAMAIVAIGGLGWGIYELLDDEPGS